VPATVQVQSVCAIIAGQEELQGGFNGVGLSQGNTILLAHCPHGPCPQVELFHTDQVHGQLCLSLDHRHASLRDWRGGGGGATDVMDLVKQNLSHRISAAGAAGGGWAEVGVVVDGAGGLFLRAVVEQCQHSGPRMKTLVTLGAPHQGRSESYSFNPIP